jgi:hypothetical protein
MSTLAELDSPLRSFMESIFELNSGQPDMDAIGRKLAAFAQDRDYLAHHMAKLPQDRFAGRDLAQTGPDVPTLLIVHRPEGVMSQVHSHNVWVALAPITGTETHRQFDVLERRNDGTADVKLHEERHLDADSADFVTMTPPNDVHEHGHALGIGDAAYILVLTARPQVQFERQQYDLERGTWQTLPTGVMSIDR